jgi:acetylornithine deacetylase
MTDLEKKVMQYVDDNSTKLFADLTKLVQFDTQNDGRNGKEEECARYIEQLYRDFGLETELYYPDDIPGIKEHPGYLPNRHMDTRPNVTGVLWGEDRERQVMIYSHIDTVPIGNPDAWTVDPFGGEVKDGRIWGRGSGDNKSGIAGSLFALEALRACGIKLKKTVALSSCVDEEYGGGDGALAMCLKYPSETIVNTDGSGYQVWVCALGGGAFRLTMESDFITATAQPLAEAAVLVWQKLMPFAQRRFDQLKVNPLYIGSYPAKNAFRLTQMHIGHESGTIMNRAIIKFAIYTDRTKEEIFSELDEILTDCRKELAKMRITLKPMEMATRWFTYQRTKDEFGAAALMQKVASEVSGQEVPMCGSCLTDQSVIMPYGSDSSFCFGIFRDFSVHGGAHQPDEYCDCQEFINFTKSLILFLIRYCGVDESSFEEPNEE